MEQAPRAGRPGPADPGAAALHTSARHTSAPGPADDEGVPPDEVPEVAEAVEARAVDLRRLAEELHGTVDDELAGALRAHAGDVDALAGHLRDAGGGAGPAAAPP